MTSNWHLPKGKSTAQISLKCRKNHGAHEHNGRLALKQFLLLQSLLPSISIISPFVKSLEAKESFPAVCHTHSSLPAFSIPICKRSTPYIKTCGVLYTFCTSWHRKAKRVDLWPLTGFSQAPSYGNLWRAMPIATIHLSVWRWCIL